MAIELSTVPVSVAFSGQPLREFEAVCMPKEIAMDTVALEEKLLTERLPYGKVGR
ncbi:hypothetical protein [Aporhodopirellula aestuarii]|uniref:Uncharacterized protein n=1 Tax=Aporhodopirellula aestuarii TaxID=2950107 RepID=A0ABT0U822_9BACT|nr:hypothetical protein [Aporhodopirellula aestuarii]MCM2372834.1 hypothetical protein [Aporhodopirellula aestuarii]